MKNMYKTMIFSNILEKKLWVKERNIFNDLRLCYLIYFQKNCSNLQGH